MLRVSKAQAKERISDLLERCAAKKERIVFTHRGKAMATLVPAEVDSKPAQRARKPSNARPKSPKREGSKRGETKRASKNGFPWRDDENLTLDQKLDRLSAEIPREEWEKIPSDLSDHLDDHIYGRKRT